MNMLTRLNPNQQQVLVPNSNHNNNRKLIYSSATNSLQGKQLNLEQEEEEDNRRISNNNNKMITATSQFHSLSPTHGDTTDASASSSSLSNTDSDSLHGSVPQQQQQQQNYKSSNPINNNNNNNNNSKSPILIKYNYYDYNGARQEQANHDVNYHQQLLAEQQHSNNSNGNRIQRHLSPTFKQSLDQIVRNSSQQINNSNSNSNSPNPNSTGQQRQSPPSSPEYLQQQMMHFARRYKMSSYEQRCLRCNKTVYQMDKVGPLKDFTFYHQNCFKCRECGTKLTLKTYFNNQQSSNDQEVYCHRHCPKTGPGRLDNQSVGIRTALNAPKVFDMSAGYHQALLSNNEHYDPTQNFNNNHSNNGSPISPTTANSNKMNILQNPNVDASALYIQHAVQQTRLQNIYKQSQVDKKISQFINGRLEFLEPKQKLLEMRHRQEEDALFKAFELKWRQEEKSISEQIREEWQIELSKLLEKYKRQLDNISAASSHHHHHDAQQQQQQLLLTRGNNQPLVAGANEPKRISNSSKSLLLKQLSELKDFSTTTTKNDSTSPSAAINNNLDKQQHQTNNNNNFDNELSKQQMIEFERMNLEKTMTIKLDRKKETLKRKLKEFERQATAELVEKQSREMLALISMKLNEYKEEQKRKIGSELEQFEAIESLANQLGSSLQMTTTDNNNKLLFNGKTSSLINNNLHQQNCNGKHPQNRTNNTGSQMSFDVPPSPKPPKVSKMELYNNEEPDEVFKDIDQLAINVAKEDQQTFTDLVHHLTRHCLTDIEKVRAIFRWITVKNLNTMQFDSSVKPDTPLGLLRGIKNGSESYHVLFKRLCSYAGLHCVVIKGYSKSAGYQPGVKFEGNRFRNSWNAVYVAGAWRFVQCNWGARHLVSVAVMQDKNNSNKQTTGANNNNNSRSSSSSSSASLQTTSDHARHHHRHSKSSSSSSSTSSSSVQVAATAHKLPHHAALPSAMLVSNSARSQQQQHQRITSPNHGRRGLLTTQTADSVFTQSYPAQFEGNNDHQPNHTKQQHHLHHAHYHQHQHQHQHVSSPLPLPLKTTSSSSSSGSHHRQSAGSGVGAPLLNGNGGNPCGNVNQHGRNSNGSRNNNNTNNSDSLRYEYDDHYFLTDPDEFIYEFFPLSSEWQLIKSSPRPITLTEFEQLPFVRSLFFKYGLYFPQPNIRSVLYTDSSGATTIKIGMPTHMIPSLIFHYNLKFYDSDLEHYDGISLKRFVMQSVESGTANDGQGSSTSGAGQQVLLSNIVSFRVHLPENGAYILDIFANSTTPTQYITGEPMKFKSVCKFKIIAKNLKTVMIPLPDCASGEYGPLKATRLFGIIPITHECGLISVLNDKRFLEIQLRMTRPLLDFMASLHKNGYDERQLSKAIKTFIDGDIVCIQIKFFEDGQYGLDIYTRDQVNSKSSTSTGDVTNKSYSSSSSSSSSSAVVEPKNQLLTHCCKYLINVRASNAISIS